MQDPFYNSDGSSTEFHTLSIQRAEGGGKLNPIHEEKYQNYLRQAGMKEGETYADMLSRRQTEANMKAVQPAVDSLSAGIPELQQAYKTRQQQLTNEKDPLIARYEQLLNEIRGRETSQVNDVTRTTNREMGRRGITLDSTFAADETQGRTAPIRSAAQSDILTTTFDREAKLREIDNTITNLNSEMVQAERDIRNSIAQIQAQAGTAGVAQAIQLYQIAQQQRQQALDRALKERELNANIAKSNSPTNSITEIGGRKILLSYDSQGNVVNRTDLGPSGSGGSGTGGFTFNTGIKTTTQQPVAQKKQYELVGSTPQSLPTSQASGNAPGLWQKITGLLGATPSYTEDKSGFLSNYNIGGIKLK